MIIYIISNKLNGKEYVGQTKYDSDHRLKQHIRNALTGRSGALYSAFRKYGAENFVIREIDGANSQDELNYKEWFLVLKHNTLYPNGYNLKDGGGSKGDLCNYVKEKISKKLKGVSLSENAKINHQKAIDKRFNSEKAHPNSILAMLDNAEKTSKSITCIITGLGFKSISEASKYLNTATSNICKNLKGMTSHVKGCNFVYDLDPVDKPKFTNKKGRKRLYRTFDGKLLCGDVELSNHLKINISKISNKAREIDKLIGFLNKHQISIVQ